MYANIFESTKFDVCPSVSFSLALKFLSDCSCENLNYNNYRFVSIFIFLFPGDSLYSWGPHHQGTARGNSGPTGEGKGADRGGSQLEDIWQQRLLSPDTNQRVEQMVTTSTSPVLH